MSTKVLIVDDEVDLPYIIKDYLEDEIGFEINLVVSGEQGLECIDKFQPDICIVDIRLPKMNGNDFIIKVHEKIPQCKYIIHTGSIDYLIPAQLSQIGITNKNVVYKPVFDLSEFSEKIRRLLQS